MNDRDIFIAFAKMMGFNISGDGSRYVGFMGDGESREGKVHTRGYDNVSAYAEFTPDGELVEAFNISHVAISGYWNKGRFRELQSKAGGVN